MPSIKERLSRRRLLGISLSSLALLSCNKIEPTQAITPPQKPQVKPTETSFLSASADSTISERGRSAPTIITPTPTQLPVKLNLKEIPEVVVAEANLAKAKADLATAQAKVETAKPKVEQFWTQEISLLPQVLQIPPAEHFKIYDNVVYTTDANGFPQAISKDGKKIWTWEDREPAVVCGKDEDTIYVLRPDQRIYAIDLQNGKTKWKVIPEIQQGTFFRPKIFVQKETIHIAFASSAGSRGTPFLTIDKKTQNMTWLEENASAIDVFDGTILAHYWAGYGRIFGFDAKSGQEKWYQDLFNGNFSNNGLRSQDGIVYYLVNKQNEKIKFEAREIATGKKVFEGIETGDLIKLVSKDIICIVRYGSYGNPQSVDAFDPKTGSKKFTIPIFDNTLNNNISGDLLSIQDDLVLHTQKTKGITSAIDVKSGKVIWENDDFRPSFYVGREARIIVATSQDQLDSRITKIHFIDATTGKSIKPPITQNISFKPILVGDKIACITQNGLSTYNLDGTPHKTIPIPIFKGFILSVASFDKNKILAAATLDRKKILLLGIDIA